jgi:flagellar biosynthesis chaperone FliJ
MRKWTILLLFSLVALSCNRIEKFRQPIEDLNSQWATATQAVEAFSANLQSEYTAAQEILAGMSKPDSMAHTPEVSEQMAKLRETVRTQITDMGGLRQAVDAFVTEWTTKSIIVGDLKESLSSNEFEGDVQATLDGLQEMLNDNTKNLGLWTGRLNDAKNKVVNAYQAYQTLNRPEQ